MRQSAVVALIIKELLMVLRDPKSRLSIIFPPLVQLLIFAYAATLDVKNVSIGVINRDSGEKGFELVQRFRGSPTFTKILYLESMDQIGSFMDEQKALMVLSIDETFSRKLDAEKVAEVQLILDGRKSNTTQILLGYTKNIIDQFAQDHLAKSVKITKPIALITRNWFNPNLIYLWYNIPSLVATLSMITCIVVTTQSVAREREVGTLDQLLVSPLKTYQILIGKTVPGIVIGMLEGMFMGAVGVWILKVPFVGSFSLFCLSILIFVTAISGIGLFISTFSATQQQALLGAFTFLMPAILLSGFATPIENIPQWLQTVTYVNPLRYMLVITKGIFLKDMSGLYIFENIWPMILIGSFTLLIAGFFFRKRFQ